MSVIADVLFADPDFTHATKEQLAKMMIKKEVESSEDEDLEVGLSNNLKQPISTKVTRTNTKGSEELESPTV